MVGVNDCDLKAYRNNLKQTKEPVTTTDFSSLMINYITPL